MSETEVLITDEAHEAMVAAARAALPRETGGFLAGFRVDDTIVVTRAIVVDDVDSTGGSYLRRGRSASRLLTQLRADAPDIVGYVGEWHVHPANRPPSRTDVVTLRQAARDAGDAVALVVLPFVGKDPRLPVARIGEPTAGRRVILAEATVRTTSTTPAELEARSQVSIDHGGDERP